MVFGICKYWSGATTKVGIDLSQVKNIEATESLIEVFMKDGSERCFDEIIFE